MSLCDLPTLDVITCASGLTLHQHWQEMGALEGVAGVLMFGVSTAYMFFVMQLYLPDIHAIRRH
jgi:hypothetical protein